VRLFAGAHLISRGCILYGTLTMEMAMRMPRGTMGASRLCAPFSASVAPFKRRGR